MPKPPTRQTPTPRCDWRSEGGTRCKQAAQGSVGMLNLCKSCFGTKMARVPFGRLSQPVELRLTDNGRNAGYATWIPFGRALNASRTKGKP